MLTEAQKESRKARIGCNGLRSRNGFITIQKPDMNSGLEKTGQSEDQPILGMMTVSICAMLDEETIAREYARRNNVKLRRVNKTVYHKRLPFMFCNLDRVIIGQKKIVECKSSSGFMRFTWGESGTDEAPIYYILQVQHQIACSEYDDADIAALIDIDDYRIFNQPRNEKVIKKFEDANERFWIDHVLDNVAPEATNQKMIVKLMYPL